MPRSTHSDNNVPCKTPSPRSSASQVPPNPRHTDDDPSPRANPHAYTPAAPPHPFKGLSRKFMSRKETEENGHRRGRASLGNGLDIGSAHGVYDTPNVRERVRRWQAAGGGVVNCGDPIELPPPISPATPTPAATRAGSQAPRRPEGSVTTRASSLPPTARPDTKDTPLSPPRVVGKEDWDSASEAEKEEARLNARNKERERKLKRRANREHTRESGSIPGTPDAGTDIDSAPGGTPLKEEAATVTEKSYLDDDGIRVAPLRTKRRGSGGRRKKKEKEKEEEKQEPEAPTGRDDKDEKREGTKTEKVPKADLKSETDSISSEARRREVKAWENDDGIRIYTSKPSTPIRSEASFRDRIPSVRKSEKSVKSRKEQFEAEMKRERTAQKNFEEMIRKHDEEDKLKEDQERDEEKERKEEKERRREERRQRQSEKDEKEKEKAQEQPKPKDIKLPKVANDTESVRKKWQEMDDGIRVSPMREDFDDGIRVKPLRTTKRPKSPQRKANESDTTEKASKPKEDTIPVVPEGSRSSHRTKREPKSEPKSEPATPSRSSKDKERDPYLDASSKKREPSPSREKLSSASKRERSPVRDQTERKSKRDHSPSFDSALRRELRRAQRAEERKILNTPSPVRLEKKEDTAASQKDDQKVPPEVPARPKRTRTKTVSGTPSASMDDMSWRKDRPKSTQNTPLSSTDSLPLRKEKTKSSRSTPQPDDGHPGLHERSHSTPASDSASFDSATTQKTSPPSDAPATPSRKKKGELGPKISSATSSFFKAVKAEFQATSARAGDSSSSSEESPSEEDPEVGDEESQTPTQHSVKSPSVQAPVEPPAEPAEDENEPLSEEESPAQDEPPSEEQPAATPVEDTPKPMQREYTLRDPPPLSPLPKRHRRTTSAPRKPKRRDRNRADSDGSVTPTSSVIGDGDSVTGQERSRNVSEASTVKPLKIEKIDGLDPETKAAQGHEEQEGQEARDWFSPDVPVKSSSLKRRYTKHADLISILSVPKSSKSRRSESRSRHSKHKTPKSVEKLGIPDLLQELSSEETKYMRELRTLVEDVVPVLFQTVLERADDDLRRTSSTSSVATTTTASSNRSSRAGFSANPTRPVVDMGISLERLKTTHERIPLDNVDHLLTWANDAKKVYEEYLSVWKMGWQDVVVTMSADDEPYMRSGKDAHIRKDLETLQRVGLPPSPSTTTFEGDMSTWAMPPAPPAMPEAEEDEEEKVDVAFLLKRPLVRLKMLAKLFKRINVLQSSSLALSLSTSFHALVSMARRKISEEKARIEDEVAASIDVTRVLDIHLLSPRPDVSLDQNRRVKARDSFSMRLYHSSGQVIERSVELTLRDPPTRSRNPLAEVLVSETAEGTSKWLLFPPIPMSAISARTGDAAGEIVVMVRGLDQNQQEWSEIMALGSNTAAGFEWVQMLGLIPIPPEGPFCKAPYEPAILETVFEESIAPSRQHTPVAAPKQLDDVFSYMVPEDDEAPNGEENSGEPEPTPPPPTVQYQPLPPLDWLPPFFVATPLILPPGSALTGGDFRLPTIDWTKLNNDSQETNSSVHRSPSLHTLFDNSHDDNAASPTPSIRRARKASRPNHLRKISAASDDRSDTKSPTPSFDNLEPERLLTRSRSVHADDDERPEYNERIIEERKKERQSFENIPILSPPSQKKKSVRENTVESEAPPPVPPHRTPTSKAVSPPSTPRSSTAPSTPQSPPLSLKSGFGGRRRTSSPLKHEYAPSSASDSGSDIQREIEIQDESEQEPEPQTGTESEEEQEESDYSSSSSEDSDDAVSICSEEEDGEYPPPMLSIPRRVSRQLPGKRPSSMSSVSTLTESKATPDDLEKPVHSEPQTPTQRPEIQPHIPIPQIGMKFRCMVFTWATNKWEKIYPGDCRVIVTPGHVDAIPTTSPASTPGSPGTPTKSASSSDSSSEPVFSLDLTPNTPIRRGTAVDISIRTPNTSKFNGASIMLRCRSPDEGEALLNAMNNNRMYPANYLPPTVHSMPSSIMGTSVGASESSITLAGSIRRGFGALARSKSYRAGQSSVTPSIISSGFSESSMGSLSSAFSRFRQNNRFFRSSPLSSLASSSSNSVMGDGSPRDGSPTYLANLPAENENISLSNMKVRLYKRENASKWRDLGNARLNILKPPEGHKGYITGGEKRIFITNKQGNVVMLDSVLGEAAFERVARTGIAISIFTGEGEEDGTGKPGAVGGIGAKSTVYMMQMKGEAEAAYTFSIAGKLRY